MNESIDEPLSETPPSFLFPFGSTHHEAHDTLWTHLADLERREADTFDSILVKNALEIRGQEAVLILSPEDQSGAYSLISVSRQSSGSLSVELTEYADHSHATDTILLQVNLTSRRVFVGKASFPLDADAVPTISGVLDDPAEPPMSAAVGAKILAVLAAAGLLKDMTTMAPAETP